MKYLLVYFLHHVPSSLWHHSLISALSLHHVSINGFHPRSVGDTKIIPHLETVAGEALFRFSTSNTILQNSDIGILSALAKVRILLSSSTVLRFSIQIASTGPSQIIQETCLFCLPLHFFQIYEKIPGTQSFVVKFIIPYISWFLIALGFILTSWCLILRSVRALVRQFIIVDLPLPAVPTTMNPCRTKDVS